MTSWFKDIFTRKIPLTDLEPLTDSELYFNLNESAFTYLSVLNEYRNNENQVIKIGDMSQNEIEYTYQLVVDAALSNLNQFDRENLKSSLLEIIPEDLTKVRKNISNADYLPPPMPQKFTGWIQGVINKKLPVSRYTSDGQFGYLMNYIASAFVQGNPPRSAKDITKYENNLITLLFLGTHRGIDEAAQIKDSRSHSNRHLSQILMLSLILGIKHSRDNNLEAST